MTEVASTVSKTTSGLDNNSRQDIRYIVIHHTATDPSVSAEDVLTSMKRRYWDEVPTHYIVDANGSVVNATPIDIPAGWFSTQNGWLSLDNAIKLNWQSIHIEVVGTWTDTENTAQLPKAQEDALRNLVKELKTEYPQANLTAHSLIDRNKWSCWQAVLRTIEAEPAQEKSPVAVKANNNTSNSKWINISLSRYYSVMPDQEAYYGWRTYEEDFKINCHWDCLTTADGHQLNSSEAGLVVACPKEYPLWTRFYVEWLWEVTCHDRWGKIVTQWQSIRLDVRSWIWDEWRLNIQQNRIRTWKTRWYVIQ